MKPEVNEEKWNEIFNIVFNPDKSIGTKKAFIIEKFNPPIRKNQSLQPNIVGEGVQKVDVEKLADDYLKSQQEIPLGIEIPEKLIRIYKAGFEKNQALQSQVGEGEKVFRKVSVKERLPEKEGYYLISIKVSDNLLPVNHKNPYQVEGEWARGEWQIHQSCEVVNWLEEITLPIQPLQSEIAGYLFNGRFYRTIEELRGKTMSDDNQPVPLYTSPHPLQRGKSIEECKDEVAKNHGHKNWLHALANAHPSELAEYLNEAILRDSHRPLNGYAELLKWVQSEIDGFELLKNKCKEDDDQHDWHTYDFQQEQYIKVKEKILSLSPAPNMKEAPKITEEYIRIWLLNRGYSDMIEKQTIHNLAHTIFAFIQSSVTR